MAIGDSPLGTRALGEAAPIRSQARMHAQMVQRITALETALERLGELQGLVGHNRPPDEQAETPLSPQEWAEIRDALAALKAQDPAAARRSSDAVAAVDTLQNGARKVGGYLAAKGDLLITEFIKSAGAELGTRSVRLAYWGVILALMGGVVSSATEWLQSLPAP